MSIKNSPAFPGSEIWNHYGMTLRDWFAGQALCGLASSISEDRKEDMVNGEQLGLTEAGIAYQLADAMLFQLEQREKDK